MNNVLVSLVLPCFNEAQIFNNSVQRIYSFLEKKYPKRYEVIFVEDKGHDNTVQLIHDACKRYAQFTAIFHHVNCGRGAAVMNGIRTARGDIVGYIDIDLEISEIYIADFVDAVRSGSDVVVGRRDYSISLSKIYRLLMTKAYVQLRHLFFPLPIQDTEAGYKFFNRKKILPILDQCHYAGWFWDTEVMVRSQLAGLILNEIPVDYMRRADKTSTVSPIRDSWDYLKSLIKFKKELS